MIPITLTHTKVPVCAVCWEKISANSPQRPHIAISNDLYFGYIPKMIYTEGVTIMELLCASVCHPTMISIMLECYGYDLRKEKVHMQEHRTGARGNVTAFEQSIDKLYTQFCRLQDKGKRVDLPRRGVDLQQVVQVTLMANGSNNQLKRISIATVRRDIVLRLIHEMIRRGHRNYCDYNFEDIKSNMSSWDHVDGEVPTEVLALLNTGSSADIDKNRTGKAAAPPDPLAQQDEDPFQYCTATGVVTNGELDEAVDSNAMDSTAYLVFAEELANKSNKTVSSFEDVGQATVGIVSGQAKPQFEALFFIAAYSYLFPYGVGCPDLRRQPSDRRSKKAPKVDFEEDWSKLIMQRAEGQFRRDLTLPFALWNMVFRTIINIGHSLHGESMGALMGATRVKENGDRHSADDFYHAALSILTALQGKYNAAGKHVNVAGDLGKVSQMPGLSLLAKKMLHSMRSTCQHIPGTQETRRIMRHELMAYRVLFGTPIMVTFSPNERHNTLMIRLSRVRLSDPFAEACPDDASWGGLYEPEIIESTELGEIHMSDLVDRCPDVNTRR